MNYYIKSHYLNNARKSLINHPAIKIYTYLYHINLYQLKFSHIETFEKKKFKYLLTFRFIILLVFHEVLFFFILKKMKKEKKNCLVVQGLNPPPHHLVVRPLKNIVCLPLVVGQQALNPGIVEKRIAYF